MSVPAGNFNFDKLRRFDGPAWFLGGGFLAGLLVFLVWLAQLPDRGPRAPGAQDNGDAATGALVAPEDGVLGGITGESGSRSGGAQVSSNDFGLPGEDEFVDEAQAQAEAGAEVGMEADSMTMGADVGEPVEMSEGAALTDGLLGPQADGAASAQAAPLLQYYVEVEVAPGQVQVLQLNAESPDHARAILRDFRGDPRVLRGPSTEPLP